MRTLHISLYGLHESSRRQFARRLLEALDEDKAPAALVEQESSLALPRDEPSYTVVTCMEQYRRQALLEGRVRTVISEQALAQRLSKQSPEVRHPAGALLRELTSTWQQMHVRLLEPDEQGGALSEETRRLDTLVGEWSRGDFLAVAPEDEGVRWALLSARALLR